MKALRFTVKILTVVLCAAMCISAIGCGRSGGTSTPDTVVLPDILDVKEENAESLLFANGLIPSFAYQNSNTVKEGHVINYSSHAVGDLVDKNSKIIVLISKGPKRITAKDSVITWHQIGTQEDEWDFYTPYKEDGYIYITCMATFKKAISWRESGFGEASITDAFDKTVPIKIEYNSKEMDADKKYTFTLKIPTADLDNKLPTTLYLALYAEDESSNRITVSVNFTISW